MRTHHQRRTSMRGHGYFKRLGPGIVTGAADDDPSGIATYSQVGAAQGLSLLWMAPFLLPLAVGVQESSARLGLVTGKGLGTLIRERFPRWAARSPGARRFNRVIFSPSTPGSRPDAAARAAELVAKHQSVHAGEVLQREAVAAFGAFTALAPWLFACR